MDHTKEKNQVNQIEWNIVRKQHIVLMDFEEAYYKSSQYIELQHKT